MIISLVTPPTTQSETKYCRVCGCELVAGENWYNSRYKRKERICKTCDDEHTRTYRQNNLEKKREYDRRYRQNNLEKMRNREKKYRQNNLEKIKGWRQNYYQNNREKIIEHTRTYRQNNLEKVKSQQRIYRRKKLKEHRGYNFKHYWLRGGRNKQKNRNQTCRARKIELYLLYRHHRNLLKQFNEFFPLYMIRMVDI